MGIVEAQRQMWARRRPRHRRAVTWISTSFRRPRPHPLVRPLQTSFPASSISSRTNRISCPFSTTLVDRRQARIISLIINSINSPSLLSIITRLVLSSTLFWSRSSNIRAFWMRLLSIPFRMRALRLTPIRLLPIARF